MELEPRATGAGRGEGLGERGHRHTCTQALQGVTTPPPHAFLALAVLFAQVNDAEN